jgi:hypothetical protein
MTSIQLRKARIRNLKQLYQGYCLYFNNNAKWSSIIADTTDPNSLRVSFPAAILMNLLHIIYTRLSAISRSGSISNVFQPYWNPIILEVSTNNMLVGGVFLEKCSSDVLELEAIFFWTKLKDSLFAEAILNIVNYAKTQGVSKIIMKSPDEEIGRQLCQSGFNLAISNSVMSMDFC